MLKKLTYLAVISYVFIIYGGGLFDFGSDIRKDIYFIGMSLVQSLIGYILFCKFKNIATSYLLFMLIGESFNQILFAGDLSYIEIAFGFIGVIYILVEPKIKKKIKVWKFKK